MAKPPSKRRGIMLNPRTDSAASLDLLSAQPMASDSVTSDQAIADAESASGGGGAIPERMSDELAELRRMNADLDDRWRRQTEQMQEQLQQLEQQREEIALQTCQLQDLERKRQSSGRVGVLLALLAITGVGALGFHTWPPLQYVAGDLNRVSTNVTQLAPQVQDVRREVTSLTSDMGQMGSTVASLEEDVSNTRADLGSLRKVMDTLPEKKGRVQASAGGKRSASHTAPRTATTMTNPYRSMYRVRPW